MTVTRFDRSRLHKPLFIVGCGHCGLVLHVYGDSLIECEADANLLLRRHEREMHAAEARAEQ